MVGRDAADREKGAVSKMQNEGLVRIDGSSGEGGGQILRTSVSLAALTGRPLEIHAIRGRRPRPGLQAQHLTAVRAAAALCGARLEGDAVGSQTLRFEPVHGVQAGEYHFDIGTAGATGLVAQTLLPALVHAGASTAHVTGGTHVPHAPTAEYVSEVYLPTLAAAGVRATWRMDQPGFFPRGRGAAELHIAAEGRVQPLVLEERGKLTTLRALILTSRLPEHVAERGAAAVRQCLKEIGRTAEVEIRRQDAMDPGAAVVLVAECEGGRAGFTGLGERGKPMEKVAAAPCEEFLAWWKSGAAVDEHLADQLVPLLALAPGESRWTAPTATPHLSTVLEVAGRFLPITHSITPLPSGAVRIILSS